MHPASFVKDSLLVEVRIMDGPYKGKKGWVTAGQFKLPDGLGETVAISGSVQHERVKVDAAEQAQKLVVKVEPIMPPLARQAGVTGTVRFNAVIAPDGSIKRLLIASGHPLLFTAAKEAVGQWVYKPTLLNGKAVEVETQIELEMRQ